jgi:hypothetical protein
MQVCFSHSLCLHIALPGVLYAEQCAADNGGLYRPFCCVGAEKYYNEEFFRRIQGNGLCEIPYQYLNIRNGERLD